ncbi:hypothetical protein THAOC_26637 [Thalassiosira oceanica]|uniref:SCP domain-containing protein n=1 Tax=Thalassiosira oceanica TaxID=159749 RepID=K0RNL0_THAOC|nr:hypothetical protein THAOC_26637 [Thalassiosira oceanica]|eukprot:EJK53844.1 hypothetical protein THAOC_26637 [Thalassiosira oceanica]
MIMRVGSKVLGLTFFLSISLSFSEDVACQTSQQCDDMREELGYEKLFVGNDYPANGCFQKGGRMYFGSGGSPAQNAEPNLPGVLERVWCKQAPTTCLTDRQCDERRQELGISVYRVDTNYPSKGCFKKGNVAYFGIGGNVSDMSTTELPGARERIQCVGSASGRVGEPPIMTSTMATTAATITNTETTVAVSCPDNQYRIKVVVQTGPQNTDSGFKLSSGGRAWLDNPLGSLPPLTDYADSVCLSDGRYRLRLEAEWNGIKRYWVYVNGEEVLRGPAVNSSIKYHIIRVGYKPTLSTREQEWLEGHNSRRQDFHESNGKEFRPLKWSEKLVQQAKESADAIIANNCKYTGSSGGDVGENKSIRRHGRSGIIPEPDLILKNWFDQKLDREYPDNTMTAVVWRGSRWIGCAESTGMDDEGFFCHATVCQYSRPGNCNVRSFDNWLDAVLDDGSMCGAVCPDSLTPEPVLVLVYCRLLDPACHLEGLEMIICTGIEWRLNPPTPSSYVELVDPLLEEVFGSGGLAPLGKEILALAYHLIDLSLPCLGFVGRRPSSVAAAALLASMEMVRLPPSAADWFRSLPLGLDDGANDEYECLALFGCLVECNRLRPRVVLRGGEESDGATSEKKAKKKKEKKKKGRGRRVSPKKCRPKKCWR